jgi:WD40 repeat protein
VPVATLAARAGSVTSAAFSADGSLVVTGGSVGAARIWETATGKLLYVMDRHEGAVVSVAFGDADRRVRTAAADGARIWDIAPDPRPAAEIARDVRCRVPLRLEGDVIIAAEPDAACR